MSDVLSKRELIMQHLAERFAALREGVDGYTTTWNAVTRRPMGDQEVSMGNALGLFDVEEEKNPAINWYHCNLRVVAEFYYVLQLGDEPSTELNRMLVDIQRAIRVDVTCGGLAFNIVELRNELDVDGPADRLVAGVVEFQVQYRHLLDDPRKP